MSAFKPRKVDSTDLFATDYREEKKFWYLDPVVQPVVHVRSDGLFEDPAARVVVPSRMIMAYNFADATVGNLTFAPGLPGQVWEVRSLTCLSGAGGNYTVQEGAVDVSPIVAIAIGATEELVTVAPIPVLGDSQIGIGGGVAGDAYNHRLVRVL